MIRTIRTGVSLAALATVSLATLALVDVGAAYAQETTSIIRGAVTAAGAPVAGAEIVVTNVPSGTVSRTRSDSSGIFSVAGLRSGGPYTVEVTSPAGNTKITDIFASVGQPYDLPVELAPSTDVITVTASSIKRAGVSSTGPLTVLNATEISKVASINRDLRDVERRSPFANIDLSNGRFGAVSFAGVNPRFNRFTINGAQIGDQFGLNADASPTNRGPVPYDAIEQVSVSIAPFGDIRQSNFQGGVIDVTLKSGTNNFHVDGFYSQSTDGLQGNQIGPIFVTLPKYKSETYGATVSGPIIKDKIFFMGSYERNTDPRPLFPGSVSQVFNLTDAQLSRIQAAAKNIYNYDTGGVLAITNNLDEKFVVKLDFNLSDSQKLSVSYINAYDAQDSPQNSSTSTTSPRIGLASNAYKLTELVRTGAVQLNSDWTDRLSTETRFVYRSTKRGQDPELGRGFAQFTVCTANLSAIDSKIGNSVTSCGTGNPTVSFGPDISRQTNALFTDTYDGSLLLRYQAGTHNLNALFQYVENRTTNAFLQYSAGSYYFDSITDLENRRASAFDYQNALTLNPNDTTANWKYGQYTFGLQDVWTIDPKLSLTFGARYDLYASSSPIAVNQNFVNRYGFANNQTFKGLYAFQPRASFDYKPLDNLVVRGGAGIFAGGTPDIYFSNAYSNPGGISNRIQRVVRATTVLPNGQVVATDTCAAPYNTPATAAVCQAALNGVVGSSIPSVVNSFLSTNVGSVAQQGTASVDPKFRIPSVTRATLSVDYKLFGVNVGADYIYSRVNQAPTFTDLRSRQIGVLPDGRPRYDFVPTPGIGNTSDTNTDIQFTNTTRGRSHLFDVHFDKQFAFGLSLGGSYTRSDVKDVSNSNASTAGSLYGGQVYGDPNNAAYGTSDNQIKWQFKYSVGYDHAFFRDYRTVFQLFGETRAGLPYSYLIQDAANSTRSPVFGSTASNFLPYVPTGISDPRVSYDSPATAAAFDALINSTKLAGYRGQIAPKNIERSRANTRIDLHLEQEVPTFVGRSRFTVFADIQNFGNLLNKNWGALTQVSGQAATIAQVQCLTAPVATGTAPAAAGQPGSVATAPSQACAQYRYTSPVAATENALSTLSLYLIRVGVRFKF